MTREQIGRQTVLGVGDELLLQFAILPTEVDGILMVFVSISDGDVSLLVQVFNRLSEVCLNQSDHSFLLVSEGLQILNFTCTFQLKQQFQHQVLFCSHSLKIHEKACSNMKLKNCIAVIN